MNKQKDDNGQEKPSCLFRLKRAYTNPLQTLQNHPSLFTRSSPPKVPSSFPNFPIPTNLAKALLCCGVMRCGVNTESKGPLQTEPPPSPATARVNKIKRRISPIGIRTESQPCSRSRNYRYRTQAVEAGMDAARSNVLVMSSS